MSNEHKKTINNFNNQKVEGTDETSLEHDNADIKSLDNFTEQKIEGEKVIGGQFILKRVYFPASGRIAVDSPPPISDVLGNPGMETVVGDDFASPGRQPNDIMPNTEEADGFSSGNSGNI